MMIRTKRHACFHVGRGQPSAHHSARDEYQRVGLALGTTFVRIGSMLSKKSVARAVRFGPRLIWQVCGSGCWPRPLWASASTPPHQFDGTRLTRRRFVAVAGRDAGPAS
jgi:hypothetical protein